MQRAEWVSGVWRISVCALTPSPRPLPPVTVILSQRAERLRRPCSLVSTRRAECAADRYARCDGRTQSESVTAASPNTRNTRTNAAHLIFSAVTALSACSDDTCCSQCPNRRENWYCLQCHVAFCGRFAQGHMLAHYEATGHCVAAGFDDLSFWSVRRATIRTVTDVHRLDG
jgi:hypothetical protein